VKLEFSFPSHEAVPVIINVIRCSFLAMGCQVQVPESRIKAAKMTPRGIISVCVRVESRNSFRRVHIKRGRG